jgi:PAS domain S-box-containing protein
MPSAAYFCEAPEGAIRYYNREAVKLWGSEPRPGDPDSHYCGPVRLIVNGREVPRDRSPVAEAIRTGRPLRERKVAIVRHDGSSAAAVLKVEPVRDAGGRVIGAIGLLEDAARPRPKRGWTAAHALGEETSALLAAIVESSDDAIVSKDLDGTILTWNAGAERIYGYTAEEAVGKPMTMLLPSDRADEEAAILEKLKNGERVDHFESVRRRKDGCLIHVSASSSPVRDGSGRIIGASHISRDITGRKRNEHLLSRERAVLQQIGMGAPLDANLTDLVRIVEETSEGDSCASILLTDRDGVRLRHAAAATLPRQYMEAVDGLSIGPQAGSCGTAAYRRETVIAEDVGSDPLWADYRDVALRFGLRACWSTPIIGTSGDVLGTFAVYSRVPRRPRAEELQMLEFVSRTAAIAIERKLAEEERAELLARERAARADAERAHQRALDILESISDGFAALDRRLRFTYVNRAAEAALGRARGDLLGTPIFEAYPGLRGTAVETNSRKALAARRPVQFEMYYAPLQAWFECNVYPSEPEGISVYFRNVSDRKQNEEMLRRSAEASQNQQEWLEAVVDLMPTPMLFIEPETAKVNFANRAANEAAGGDFPTGVPAEKYHTVYCGLDSKGERIPDDLMPGVRVARGERLERFQMAWRTPAGDRALLIFGDTLPAMHGHPATSVLMFQDISELKNTDEALRRAQKLESLGVLAGGVAHDFNNLLTGIMGNASILAEELTPEDPHQELIREISRASERAAGLTRQLLAYSGKGRFVLENIDVSQQVREIRSLIHTSLPKTVNISLELDQNLPAIIADGGQIQQVIMNLVINAAEAIGPDRSGWVVLKTRVQDVDAMMSKTLDDLPEGRYVDLEVHDNGCGMDEATKAKMFDPFFTTKFLGRGLGLAAVLGIVRGHNGAIKVYSTPNEGTTIKVLFPAEREKAPARGPEIPEEELAGSGLVLFVDDEATVRQAARNGLLHYGYTVVAAADGQEAVELFRAMAGRVKVVILDLTMPVMGGEETLKHLRAFRPDVPVVLSSGYHMSEVVERFAGKGLAGFIQKPYTAAGLAEAVKKALAVR